VTSVFAGFLGIVLFAVAAHGLEPSRSVEPKHPTPASVTWERGPERPLTIYYIVATQAQGEAVIASEAAAEAGRVEAGLPSLQRDIHFFVASNEAEEQRIWDRLGGTDEFVRVIDLRN
jgi:hypothetical protein